MGSQRVAALVPHGQGPAERRPVERVVCAVLPIDDHSHDRADDAGHFARRLQCAMASLWVFLIENGVEPTNNRAERALCFAVMWRTCSNGTASVKGGLNGRYRYAKPAASWANRPMASWLMPSPVRLLSSTTDTWGIQCMRLDLHGAMQAAWDAWSDR